MKPFKNYAFESISALICFLYLMGRAAWVPISHDEAATFFHYIQTENVLPYLAHWDANNHILNSILSLWSTKLFGNDLIWLRLPNLLSFPVFVYFAFRLTRFIDESLIRKFVFLALITAWLPLEFFAQARGYGMSLAFILAAILFLIKFQRSATPGNQFLLWVFSIFAISANASLSNSYLLLLAFTFLAIAVNKTKRAVNILIYVALGIAPFLFFTAYAFELKNKGLLYYGGNEGFVEITLKTLIKYTLGTDSLPLVGLISALGILSGVFLLVKHVKSTIRNPDPGMVSAIFLLGNVVGAILLQLIFEVNYPEDRAAIYLIPYFILTLGFGLDQFQEKLPSLRYVSSILLVFPIITAANANFVEVRLWNSLPLSEEVFEQVQKASGEFDRPVVVEGYFLYMLSWGYYNVNSPEKLPPFMPRRDNMPIADFEVCYAEKCDDYAADYHQIWQNRENGVSLLRRNDIVEYDVIFEKSAYAIPLNENEFTELVRLPEQELPDSLHAIELDIQLTLPDKAPRFNFVISANNEKGENILYDYFSVSWIKPYWNGENLHFIRLSSLPEETSEMVFYLWNIDKVEFQAQVDELKFLKAIGAD